MNQQHHDNPPVASAAAPDPASAAAEAILHANVVPFAPRSELNERPGAVDQLSAREVQRLRALLALLPQLELGCPTFRRIADDARGPEA